MTNLNLDNFIFHSSEAPFTITSYPIATYNLPATVIPANTTQQFYTDYKSVVGTEIGIQTVVGVDGATRLDYNEYDDPSGQYSISAFAEYDTGLGSRGILYVSNYNNYPITTTAHVFTFDMFMYRIKNDNA